MKNLIKKTISGVIEILRGMLTIFKHAFRTPITQEYPEKKPEFAPGLGGRLALTSNQDGSLKCIGCMSCTKVCPCGDLIQIESHKDENNKPVIDKFTIDVGRCIFCGNCTNVCPKEAIVMTEEFELADYSRESLVYDKDMLALSPEQTAKWQEKNSK